MKRESLSYPDFAVMRLGSPENLMIINVLMTLETRLDLEDLTIILENSLGRQKRFRQKVVIPRSPFLRPYWIEDKAFDIHNHIQCIQTPLPGDQKLLEDLVSRLMSVDLDPSRPLWMFYLIEQYGDGSALVFRPHHSIADGVSLVKVVLSMTQDKPVKPSKMSSQSHPSQTNSQKPSGNGKEPGTMQILGKLTSVGKHLLNDAGSLDDFLRLSASTASAVGQLVFSPPDKLPMFNGPLGIKKRATWSPALSLEQVKFVSKTFSSTINDVLLSAVAGALRRYVLESDESSTRLDMHSVIPVDMRRSSRIAQVGPLMGDISNESIGNQVGAALLDLPLYIDDPVERLAAVHQTMGALKASAEGLVTYWLMSAMGAVPEGVQELATTFWLTKSSAVMSNVIGPAKQLYCGTAALDTMMGWVPQFGPVGLGISIFSYNGKVWLGVASDQNLVPDPERIVSYFLDELLLLGRQAMLSV